MADRSTLNDIKRNIEGYVGQKVTLKANKGRKRTMIREGVLENTYPSIFVVKINGEYNSVRRVSYSYSDILTESVEVTISTDNNAIKVVS
ncbi:MAG: Veg family protein [Clostridiaceae bacterium]|nr:Veg family protein [Clostridiaceae bacterium]